MDTLNTLLAKKDALETFISRIDIWLIVVGIIVVVGVAGESICGYIALLNNRKLQKVQHSIDELRRAETAFFSNQAAESNERSKRLESENLLLRSKVAEHESRLQPRRITPTRKTMVSALLKTSTNGKVSVAADLMGRNSEILGYATDVRDMMTNAGFDVGELENLYSPKESAPLGISVCVRDWDNPITNAAIILTALTSAGIDAKRCNSPSAQTNTVQIIIGAKP